jgi:hypothetical protein
VVVKLRGLLCFLFGGEFFQGGANGVKKSASIRLSKLVLKGLAVKFLLKKTLDRREDDAVARKGWRRA